MMILKYSALGHGLVKVINPLTGLYGAFDATGRTVIEPMYEEMHDFDGARAFARRDGKALMVDCAGNEYSPSKMEEGGRPSLLGRKADRCPKCYNSGCGFCNGLGFIPINYRFGNVD